LLEAGGASFRPLALEADTRPHVKIFWETLGWSDDLAGDLVEPSYDVARARARERLQDWQLSKMAKLLVEDLPERYRVVEDDGQGVGFILADESSAGDEPRLMFVSADHSRLKPMPGSYLRHVVNDLLGRGLGQLWTQVSMKTEPLRALRGELLLPLLAPGLRRLSTGVLYQERDDRGADTLHFSSIGALFDWLETPEVGRLAALDLSGLPGAIPYSRPAPELLAMLEERRDLPSHKHLALGKINGSRVLVSGREDAKGWGSGIVSEGDNDWLAAKLFDLPLHRIWRRPTPGFGARIASMPGGRPSDAAFEGLLTDLVRLAEHAGTAAEPYAVPNDLPERPRRILAALAASQCVPRLPTLSESEEQLQRLLTSWLSERPSGSWLANCQNVDEARKWLPTRARLVRDSSVDGKRCLAVTDEDGDSDDPPVIVAMDRSYLWWEGARLSCLLVSAATRNFSRGRTVAILRGDASWCKDAPKRFEPWVGTIREVADGVYLEHLTRLLMPTVQAYAELVRDLVATPNRPGGPPLAALSPPEGLIRVAAEVSGRGTRRLLQTMFDAALARGFSVVFRDTFNSHAFGWVEKHPVWLLHDHVFNGVHRLLASAEAGAESTLRSWFSSLRSSKQPM
jgi:hypothetical protein